MRIGTLVTIEREDLGIVIGHYEDPHDGCFYNKVMWVNGHYANKIELIDSICLEVICE